MRDFYQRHENRRPLRYVQGKVIIGGKLSESLEKLRHLRVIHKFETERGFYNLKNINCSITVIICLINIEIAKGLLSSTDYRPFFLCQIGTFFSTNHLILMKFKFYFNNF